MNDILNGLQWSAPYRQGSKVIEVAVPNAAFWALWRSDKQAVKEAGVKVRPASGGWECWREAVIAPGEPTLLFVDAPLDPPMYPVSQVCFVPGFVALELPTNRPWSAEQRAIFLWFRNGTGNLQVQARAGTGKTTTIKVAFSQAPEAEMLYAVFGKKNQLEAQASISDSRVTISTLHSAGYRIIRSMWHNARMDNDVEFDRARQVCGRDAVDEILNAVCKLVAFAKNQFVSPSLSDLIDLADSRDVNAGNLLDSHQLAIAALKHLELSKHRDAQGRISFNDMVWLPVAMNWVRPAYDMVVIDEAQDMNLPQLLMAKGLSRGRVCVVGDDRQAIFGFRGAAQDGMGLMRESLNAAVLPLTVTYRCPKSVVALAKEIVSDYQAADAAPEGIIRSVDSDKLVNEAVAGDAILSRANAPLMPLCLKLLRKGVAAMIEGREVGKALNGIVKKLNAKSVPAFISKVEAWNKKQKARFQNSKHFESKCEEINDQAGCLLAVAEGAANVAEISERLLSLFQDSEGNKKPTVILSSVHKAKGREWDRVYVIEKTFKKNGAGEEQNIYYVAITRAKQELIFVRE